MKPHGKDIEAGNGSMKALEFLKSARIDAPIEWKELDEAIVELEELDKELRYILSKSEESLSMGNKAQSLVFVEIVAILRNRYEARG